MTANGVIRVPQVDFLISGHRVKFKRNSLLPAAREREQVAVGVDDDETAGAQASTFKSW